MTYILNIETATKNCSVAVAKDGKTVLCKEMAEEGYSHAEKLHVFIEEILKELQLTFKDLSAIAVSQGPGSFTGLRIGVSTAKGLAYALDLPLIAIDTLAILAAQAKMDKGYIIPMIDARRMEVYSAVFNPNLEKVRDVQAEIITDDSFAEWEGPLYLIGDGAPKCNQLLKKDSFILLKEIVFPSADEMAKLSFEKFQNNQTEDVAYFEPYYLKDFLITTSQK
jgi:tRNA threonylcarbamoyladenosine biosynthesis protein TsaB